MDREVVGTANGDRVRMVEESSRDCEFNLRLSTAVYWVSQAFRGITSGSELSAFTCYVDCQFYDVNAQESFASLRPEWLITSMDLTDACLWVPMPSASGKYLWLKRQGITHQYARPVGR